MQSTIQRRRAAALFLLLSSVVAPPAVAASKHAHPPSGGGKIILTDGVRVVARPRSDLGIGHTGIDLATLKRALERLAPKFHQDPVDAKPYLYHGALKIAPGADGRRLNVAATAGRIAAELKKKPGRERIQIVEEKHAPDLTPARLKGITGVLGSYETRTTENPKRNHNIAVAVDRINGTFLSPGEMFSLNGTVGKRTHQTGFLTAHVFQDAKVVEGVGGGVSQVTGTLFNAAALAGLAIKEVHPHSRPVSYIPIGRDATVAYGAEDLKFQNDTRYPVYVAYALHGRSLRATLFGHHTPGRAFSLRPRVQHLGPGKINAQLYRVVKEKGKIVAKERLFTHAYRWNPKAKTT